MSETISSNKTIAKNTLLTYGRMLFNLVVSLYTSRVILQVLGVDDFGTYQVVGGIVSIFTFIGGSMAGATSRFLAYEIPLGNIERLKKTFSASLSINLIAAALLILVGETIGAWLVLNVLSIPSGREGAAMVVYQFSLFSTVLTFIQTPYNATIIAHEKISIFAYIGILDTFLKLLICYLVLVLPMDKLMAYAILIALSGATIQFIYWLYCKRHFQECVFSWKIDKEIMKPLLTFSGWDLFNNFCLGAKQQGLNILLNTFFSVAINAACGFSNTIYGAVRGFANNFMISVRPVITKCYSIKDYGRMQELIIDSSNFSFSLMLLLSMPFFFEGDFIVTLWLKNPPNWTVIFCQLQLSTCIISVLFSPVYYGIVATGKNKLYALQDSFLMLLSLPITYIFLKAGYSPLVPFIVLIIIEIIKSNLYVFILKKNISEYKISKFYRKSVLPCFMMALICISLTLLCSLLFKQSGWIRLIVVSVSSTLSISILSYYFLLDASYKLQVRKKIISIFFSRLS
ncbi:MATE family efflux transporter [Prevotella melaninogenica]|uniref:MATE family efflux transporter n=1 Tax=Prevotella melaninogenica TaxID=28132 RepID=UPI001BAC263A|nr:MATE family efflux transporter [Prevotella melaninogenica]QUB64812.1 MATE family efflux transporter [Prevotella melaninogenica]